MTATFKLFAAAGISLMLAGTASAADILMDPAPAPPEPAVAYNPFDGFYLGLHGGYAHGDRSGNATVGIPFVFSLNGDFEYDTDGWLLGGQMGYNFVNGGFLLGAEVSASAADINGNLDHWFYDDGDNLLGANATMDFLGQLKGKLGFVWDRFALYATGGLAIAHSEVDVYGVTVGWEFDNMHTGWSYGAGADLMLTDKVSLGVTWDHIEFDEVEDTSVETAAIIVGFPVALQRTVEPSLDVVKVHLNYHF